MRRFSYILILYCTLLLSSGCDREVGPVLPGNEEVILPEGGPYIYLDAMVDKSTRATVVEGTELEDGFGAYGFTYDFANRWTTYRVTATPNVFKDEDGVEFIAPQEVIYGGGIYSYTPVQTWSGGKYTFFAYYPFKHDSITPSGIDEEGTPWVKYAPADFLTSTENHIDVMTAMFEDTSLSSSQYVNFDFKHRLSAIDVVALNFYEYNQNDAGGNVTSEKIKIEITDLNITFNNLAYKAATFYLDSSIPSETTSIASSDPEPSYNIISGGSKLIEYSTASEFQHIDKDQTLLFIPQTDENLEVTTTVSFKKKRDNGNGPYLDEIPADAVEGKDYEIHDGVVTYISSKTTEFGQALKAGSRYFIQITFTSAAVSINILTSAEWEDLADVYHEFE